MWLIVVCAVMVVLLLLGVKKVQGDSRDVGGELLITFGLVFLAVGIIGICFQYYASISRPVEYRALETSVEESLSLLETDATMGSGLEGLELKKSVASMIEKKNELGATLYVMQNNRLMYLFKPRVDGKSQKWNLTGGEDETH